MLFRDRALHTVDVIQGLTDSGFTTATPSGDCRIHEPGRRSQHQRKRRPVFRYNDEFNPKAMFTGAGQLANANSGKEIPTAASFS
ncbi:MAG: hypothetical protein U1F98_10370 [Verrucomicrobiota bacterium]